MDGNRGGIIHNSLIGQGGAISLNKTRYFLTNGVSDCNLLMVRAEAKGIERTPEGADQTASTKRRPRDLQLTFVAAGARARPGAAAR